MLRLFVSFIFALFLVPGMLAQEVHFSGFRQVPVFFNPAYTGFIKKDLRASAIYRNQSPTYSKAFNTLGYGVEFSLLKQKNDNRSILGVGVNGYYDRSGALNFTDNTVLVDLSYIQALNRRKTYYLAFGLQAGYAFRKIDLTRTTFEEGFDGEDAFTPSVGDMDMMNARNRHMKLGAGMMAFFNVTDYLNFHVGAAVHELAGQNLSFYSDDVVRQRPRIVANFGLEGRVGKISLMPYFLLQSRKPELEALAGAVIRYNSANADYYEDDEGYSIGAGLGYRHQDALVVSVLASYKDLSLNLSYDITFSKWSVANRTVGAIELSMVYQYGFITPRVKGKALKCPSWNF